MILFYTKRFEKDIKTMKQIMLTSPPISPVINYHPKRKILALKIAQCFANLLITEFSAKKVILFGSLGFEILN